MEMQSSQMSVVTAFCIDVGATLLCQLSYIMMKFAHIDAEKNQKTAILSCKYILALLGLIGGGVIHIVVLPFCPLVLLATNSATAIVMSAMLSVWFLDERIVWRYDLPAFVLISGGTTAMVMLSKENEVQLTTEVITDQLKSLKSALFFAFYIIFVVLNYMLTRWFSGQIRLFERQAVRWAAHT